MILAFVQQPVVGVVGYPCYFVWLGRGVLVKYQALRTVSYGQPVDALFYLVLESVLVVAKSTTRMYLFY